MATAAPAVGTAPARAGLVLACSVLWLRALGDRYGRKLVLVGGTVLAVPDVAVGLLRAERLSPVLARVGAGLAAGMAYPTTLALVTGLWPGPGARKRLPCGGAPAARSPPWAR